MHVQTDPTDSILAVHIKLTARPAAYFLSDEVMIHDVEAIGEGKIEISLNSGRATASNSTGSSGMSLSGRFIKVSIVGVVTIARINRQLQEPNATLDLSPVNASRFPPLVLRFHGLLERQDPSTGNLWRLEAGLKLL